MMSFTALRSKLGLAGCGKLAPALVPRPLWISEFYLQVAFHVPSVPEERDPDPDFAFMLDPSEELFYHSVVDDTTIHKTGRRATAAGREAIEVMVTTISWGYPPIVFRDFYAPEGTTDHLPVRVTRRGVPQGGSLRAFCRATINGMAL
jgi:hypothetical protein